MNIRSFFSSALDLGNRIRKASSIDQALLFVFVLIASVFVFATFKDRIPNAFQTSSAMIDTAQQPDTTPDAISYPKASSRYAGIWSYGSTRVVEGFNREVPFSLTGAGTPELSVNGGPYLSTGTVVPGDKIRIRVMPDNEAWAERTTVVNIGGLSFDWITKSYGFAIPDTNQIPDVVDVTPGAVAYTKAIRLVGVPAGTQIKVSGDGSPTLRMNNKDYATTGTVGAGDIIFVRTETPQSPGTQTVLEYTIGTTAYQFSITTKN